MVAPDPAVAADAAAAEVCMAAMGSAGAANRPLLKPEKLSATEMPRADGWRRVLPDPQRHPLWGHPALQPVPTAPPGEASNPLWKDFRPSGTEPRVRCRNGSEVCPQVHPAPCWQLPCFGTESPPRAVVPTDRRPKAEHLGQVQLLRSVGLWVTADAARGSEDGRRARAAAEDSRPPEGFNTGSSQAAMPVVEL